MDTLFLWKLSLNSWGNNKRLSCFQQLYDATPYRIVPSLFQNSKTDVQLWHDNIESENISQSMFIFFDQSIQRLLEKRHSFFLHSYFQTEYYGLTNSLLVNRLDEKSRLGSLFEYAIIRHNLKAINLILKHDPQIELGRSFILAIEYGASFTICKLLIDHFHIDPFYSMDPIFHLCLVYNRIDILRYFMRYCNIGTRKQVFLNQLLLEYECPLQQLIAEY